MRVCAEVCDSSFEQFGEREGGHEETRSACAVRSGGGGGVGENLVGDGPGLLEAAEGGDSVVAAPLRREIRGPSGGDANEDSDPQPGDDGSPVKSCSAETETDGDRGNPSEYLVAQSDSDPDFLWDIRRPGYLEADTVAHCGNSMEGDFVWSLTFTDIYSGWTENRATWNRGAQGVLTQIRDVEISLVFPILGFDCDNGSEFLNYPLFRYWTGRNAPVSFTRGRPYHTNDSAHVEQKNWTHVRQLLGYDRFSNPDLVEPINSLYTHEWSQFQNFFCPTLKLESKERINSKIRRRYGKPQTPAERLLACPDVTPEAKQRLRETLRSLNPFHLREAIERKLKMIFNLHEETKHGSAICSERVFNSSRPTASFR